MKRIRESRENSTLRMSKDPIDLWISEWDREVRQRKSPFSKKPTDQERADYEAQVLAQEREKIAKKIQEEAERKTREKLRSIPYWMERDMSIRKEIYQDSVLLWKEIDEVISDRSNVRDVLKEKGRFDLIDRLDALNQRERDRKFIKAMNRDDD